MLVGYAVFKVPNLFETGRCSCQKQGFLLRAHAGLTARTLENLAVQKKLYAGEITQAEYFEWKVMWPEI